MSCSSQLKIRCTPKSQQHKTKIQTQQHPKPNKHTQKGAGAFREIIGRRNKQTDVHNPKRWIIKLNDNEISRKHIRTAMININSKYIDVPTSDTLTRLKLGKTQFNNSLHSYNQVDTPFCNTCTKELNEEHTEDYLHSNYTCSSTQTVINETTTFIFPEIDTPFDKRDILLATLADKHTLYKRKVGYEIVDLIWNYYSAYIINCRQRNTTPLHPESIFIIKSQINCILKLLPHSKVTKFIQSQPKLLR